MSIAPSSSLDGQPQDIEVLADTPPVARGQAKVGWSADNPLAGEEQPTRVVSTRISLPTSSGKQILMSAAMARANRFGFVSAVVFIGALAWSGIRFYLMNDGENQVSRAAFVRLAESIKNTIRLQIQQDLVYQDMIANVWVANRHLDRAQFRKLIMSEAYSPGLEAMTGMSLIYRVLGGDARHQFERDIQTEELRKDCCANAAHTGGKCASLAASGLFCSRFEEGGGRYQITQFGAGGVLMPAVGNSTEYIDRVGQEEYMVVHMIEPFENNAKVWGFNLLSSETRNMAWKSAVSSGQKTFTRRLNLVQGNTTGYGFLVWLPVFGRGSGNESEWTTAFHGDVSGLTPVGSVNGVYRAQHLLTKSIDSTYSAAQVENVVIHLFDNAPELNGKAQLLASYGSADTDLDLTIDDVEEGASIFRAEELTIANGDARWIVTVQAEKSYLSKRRSNNPLIGLIMSMMLLVSSTIERWLGHPKLAMSFTDANE
eukprot:TRINITY_DN37925_c0_g1_i2.p1 TRINITY_DN37925_c0_g1~~TRINITY_DN37925_c0_g1_i2.p1  ORF type:complete len:485 (-),score=48.89 TRINITY_DN37925_c0_g1_i2:91-1545(-)